MEKSPPGGITARTRADSIETRRGRGAGAEVLRGTEHAFDKGGHRGRGRGRRLDHTHHFICSIPSARWRGVKTPHAPLYLFYFY